MRRLLSCLLPALAALALLAAGCTPLTPVAPAAVVTTAPVAQATSAAARTVADTVAATAAQAPTTAQSASRSTPLAAAATTPPAKPTAGAAGAGSAPAAAGSTFQLPASCYREGLPTYVDRQLGACFAYPMGFTLTKESSDGFLVRGPAAGKGPEPLFATLSIEVKPYAGQDLDAVVAAFVKEQPATPISITRRSLTVGGLAATALEPVPGRLSSRVVIVDHTPANFYYLHFWPTFAGTPAGQMNAEGTQAQKDMAQLFEIVTASFAALPPAGVPIAPAARIDLPGSCLLAGSPLYISTDDRYCFAFPGEMKAQRESNGSVGFFGPDLDKSSDPARVMLGQTVEVATRDATLDKIGQDFLSQFGELKSMIKQPQITMGGLPALRFDGVPGRPTSIVIMLLREGTLFQFSVTPDLSLAPARDRVNQLVDTLIASFGTLPAPGSTGTSGSQGAGTGPANGEPLTALINFGAPLRITAPAELAAGIDTATVPAVLPADNVSPWDTHPAYAAFRLVNYAGRGTTTAPAQEARVMVYRVEDIKSFATRDQSGGMMAVVENLQKLLAARPDLAQYAGPTLKPGANWSGTALPFLPRVNAQQVVLAQPAYLSFAGGSGMRYITLFAQGPASVTDDALLYTFQGLSGDGSYYISATLPVTSGGVLAAQPDLSGEPSQWQAKLADAAAKLDTLPANRFQPSLALLDALIETIQIGE